jgi:hypothetical protein
VSRTPASRARAPRTGADHRTPPLITLLTNRLRATLRTTQRSKPKET